MPDSSVVQIMREYRARLLADDRASQERMARSWLQVEQAIAAQIELLARIMADRRAAGEDASPFALMRQETYQRLLSQMQAEVWRFADRADEDIANQQRQFGNYGLDSVEAMIQAQYNAAGATADFALLPREAVENMVGLAGDGSSLRSLLRNVYGVAAEAVTQSLIKSTALGINPRQTAREMLQAGEAGLQRSLLIARTEQLRVYRQAALDGMRSSGVVIGYKRMSARDRRVCLGCLLLDGVRYPLEAPFDEHPQGRCTMIPVVNDLPEVAWQPGADWLAEQDDKTQLSIMGSQRLSLWQSGAVALGDMVRIARNPTWGGSVGLVPLAELEQS